MDGEIRTLEELESTIYMCEKCGTKVTEIYNIGTWRCTLIRKHNQLQIDFKVPADHRADERQPYFYIPIQFIDKFKKILPQARMGLFKDPEGRVLLKVARFKNNVDMNAIRLPGSPDLFDCGF